ncbi:glycosyltransferase family 22 protein [Tulasnella calospora MUT 4182]|uniref:Mannosyltransferase n=1 Tax=Tulasnella calospora MUT 4182 TaxID=1051891 RepID=A0A0C3LUH6_9AGAM|nr:glycosyltransferase family 22 protein [Tulasnella calospora MUT 4182]
MRLLNCLDVLLFLIPALHVINAPYTKVEESFNLHATHDVLMYGVADISRYDHFIFPGAVPRSFIGSVALAWLATPVFYLARTFGLLHSKLDLQIGVRLLLGFFNSVGLWHIRRAATRRFGPAAGAFFIILTCTQFHVPYWMSRTLPNMFAFLTVNIALSFIILPRKHEMLEEKRWLATIDLLSMSTAIFRAELAMFLGPLALQAAISRKASLIKIIKIGAFAGSTSAALSTIVDSYFWGQWPLWPELSTFGFNILKGKSADWGTSPFHTYFTAFLPKMLLSSMPLALLGFIVDNQTRELSVAPIAFVTLISFIGHKEWRFIVYIVPLLNVIAARGASWMWVHFCSRSRSLAHRLAALALVGGILANVAVTSLLTIASEANYPGGVALSRLNNRFMDIKGAKVYIDNLAAQSGASLFVQEHSEPYSVFTGGSGLNWIYDKTENRTDFTDFNFVMAEPQRRSSLLAADKPFAGSNQRWSAVEVVQAFDGFPVRRLVNWFKSGGWRRKESVPGWEMVDLRDALWILHNGS